MRTLKMRMLNETFGDVESSEHYDCKIRSQPTTNFQRGTD